MIFSIDFDGTLCEDKYPDIGEPKEDIIYKCIELKRDGHQLILNTCREGNLLDNAVNWCKQFGLHFDALNENLTSRINQFNGDCRKIGADYYIDDRSLSMDEFKSFGNYKCPICGREMDETEMSRDYCYDCAMKLKDYDTKL